MIATGTSVLGYQELITVEAPPFSGGDWVVELLEVDRNIQRFFGYIALQYYEPALGRYFQLLAMPLYERGMVGFPPPYNYANGSAVSIVAWWRVPGLSWRAGIAT